MTTSSETIPIEWPASIHQPSSPSGIDAPNTGHDPGASPPERRSGAPALKTPVVLVAFAMVLCVVVVFSYLFATVFSSLQEQRDQRQLYAQFRGLLDPSSQVAPEIGGTISAGFPIALLTAKDAHIDNLVVVEGTSSSDLLAGPGHLSDTPLPGQRGNAVVVGKSTTAGAPFSDLAALRRGDAIKVVTGQGTFHYTVVDTRTGGARPPKLTSPSVLTLVTGTFGWSLSSRPDSASLIYVDATRRAEPATTPKGRPHSGPSSELPGSNDGSAVPFVALWIGVLLAVSAACWWLWARWGLIRTWLIGAPILLAVLWMLSSQVMRLLPNVY